MFGILVSSLTSPVFSRVVLALEERAHDLGYDVLVAQSLDYTVGIAMMNKQGRGVAQPIDLLGQRLHVDQRPARPDEHALALLREAFEAPAAAHEGHAELGLQRADRRGQRGLGDVARAGRGAEVTLAIERREVLELP